MNETNTTEENKQIETVKPNDWLEQEANKLGTNQEFPEKESLRLEENKVMEITIDFSKPFDEWEDQQNNAVKAIIPVTHNGKEKIFWLNKRNPLYSEIIKRGREGTTVFKILQTGKQANTKYTIVEN